MHKIVCAMAATAILLAGCTVHKIPKEVEPSPTPTASEIPRMDVAGNPILTSYAEGVFVKVENDILFMTENDQTRQFRLSSRAKKNISSLGIKADTQIIVNYNKTGADVEEAISLEKIL